MAGCCSLPPNWRDLIENKEICPKCSAAGSPIDEGEMRKVLNKDSWDLVIEREDYFRCLTPHCPVSLFSRVDDMWFWMRDIVPNERWK
ncbi:hypothetical protein LG52_3184 [Geobacillus kaustophilus]|uniref:CopZ zinc binding domain-containing protein n=2 Tax=Anoxybacillaceae TaxID=3120669 RepID=A0A0D8BU57_GEOKU|nr:hypothetical protein LG52_3184 [Geobacillus kaustophilus]